MFLTRLSRRWRLTALTFLLLLIAGTGAGAQSQAGPAGAPAGPYNQQQWWVPITIRAPGPNVVLLETVVYRPVGNGPFPLVTINHGKPRRGTLPERSMHPDYIAAAKWFVDRGFVVAVPMRRGYGASQGSLGDFAGNCEDRDYFESARLTAIDIEGVIAYMQRQSFVDPRNVVVLGHSWGGLGALGVAFDGTPGVTGIINFAAGGSSVAPGQICGGEDRLIADFRRLGSGGHIPEIWLYAENDHYFAPPLAHAMYEAYRAVARAPITFVDLPAFNEDGHFTIMRGDTAIWGPAVAKFLSFLPSKN